jgi:C1A family cysteine protease
MPAPANPVTHSDALQAGLVKNSCGATWGMGGYGWIGHGDSGIV